MAARGRAIRIRVGSVWEVPPEEVAKVPLTDGFAVLQLDVAIGSKLPDFLDTCVMGFVPFGTHTFTI